MKRTGILSQPSRLSLADYANAAVEFGKACTQLEPDGKNCAVCGDSGHQAWECHHNPLAMMREAERLQNAFRCYHCGEVFTTDATAMAHFGEHKTEQTLCQMLTPGVGRIAAERQRQIFAEEFDAAHDARHTHGSLALAAIVYACPPERKYHGLGRLRTWRAVVRRHLWPWESRWYKPKDRVRDLVRAGALIAAEVDRLLAAGQGA